MYFSLPQLFVFLLDVLSVAVFVIRDRFVKKKKKKSRLVLTSLSLCNEVLSYLSPTRAHARIQVLETRLIRSVLLPVLDVCLVTLCITASAGCMPGDVVYYCQCWMYFW